MSKTLLPKLRFPEFQDEWRVAKIGDFIESYKGGAPLTPSDFVPYSEYEVIPKKAMSEDMWLKLDTEKPTYCKENFYKENLQSVVDNTYLITTLRDLVPSGPSIGYIVKYAGNKKFILAQGVYGFKPKKTINSDFLIHFSKTGKYRRMMQAVMVGSTQVHIRNSVYFDLPISVPSTAEQQKIADCLTSLDDLIAAQSQKVEALQTYKKGLLQNLFHAEGESVPRLRFPEFESAGEWETAVLSEVYSFKVTNSFSRDQLNYTNGSVKNIHYGDIHMKFSTLFDITKETVPYIDPSQPIDRIRSESYCVEGDMIFADASEDLNDVGKSIEIVNLNNDKLVSGLHTLLARQITPKLVIGFGGYLFKSDKIRTQIKKEAQGAKVLGISSGRLSSIEICFPSDKKEQQRIVELLSALDEEISAQGEAVAALKVHKRGLMQGLFP